MKEKELRENSICDLCDKKIMHTGFPLFWTASIKRHGIKMDAVKRQAGLEMMMDGHVALAQVLSPNEDMTETITSIKITLCEDCADPLLRMVEKYNNKEKEDAV